MTYIRREEGDDFRYSMTVYLIRDTRPKYWEFHCPYCSQKVCELNGQAAIMCDVVNNQINQNNPPFRVRCPGTNAKWCRMWYEFAFV